MITLSTFEYQKYSPEDEIHLEEFWNVDPNGQDHAGQGVQQEPAQK